MNVKNLAMTAMFAAITMVIAPLSIVLPISLIPFTLSLIPVFLTGALLPKSCACYAQLIYLALGAVGLPVFSQFKSGIGSLAGPTGGFLVAYPIMAFLIAFLLERFRSKGLFALIVSIGASLAVCYLLGSLWFMISGHVSWGKSLMVTVVPFIAFDVIKIGFSAILALAVSKALSRAKLLPT